MSFATRLEPLDAVAKALETYLTQDEIDDGLHKDMAKSALDALCAYGYALGQPNMTDEQWLTTVPAPRPPA